MYTYPELYVEMVNGMRVYHTPFGPLPSITTVLGGTPTLEKKNALEAWRARIGEKKANDVSQAAMNRGTNMHLMLERALRGEDPQVEKFPVGHADMFRSLRLELKKITKVCGQEVVLFSDVLGVAGRCDLIAEYKGELAVVDYKSSTRVKSGDEIGDYWLQVLFYLIAHNEMFGTDIEKMIILMGVENKLPMVFKRKISDELILELVRRVNLFYENL